MGLKELLFERTTPKLSSSAEGKSKGDEAQDGDGSPTNINQNNAGKRLPDRKENFTSVII